MEGKKWEIILVTELRKKTQGVKWLRGIGNQTVFIHSQRSGKVLRGETVKSWIEEGQKKRFPERTSAVETHSLKIVYAYQTLGCNGIIGIEEHRHCLDNEITRND